MLTASRILDLFFSGEADFLEEELGRLLLLVDDCLPDERPEPVRDVAGVREKGIKIRLFKF